MTAKTIVFIVLAILIVIFTIQNTQVVEIRFFLWKTSISGALMLLSTLFIGIILGWLLTWTDYSRRKRKVKAEEKKPL
ncbi:MAG: lipopolysaccharide assembly LapA domain-containing protein, partial [Thermodesulfobacteriota bacterium]